MTISATTRGLRPGVCTSTTRPGSPFDGQLIYETDTNRVAVYDTNTWVYKTPASTTGSVLQVVSTAKEDTFSTSSTTYTDVTGLTVAITPSATSSKILLIAQANFTTNEANGVGVAVRFNGGNSSGYIGDTAGTNRVSAVSALTSVSSWNVGWSMVPFSMVFLDSPATTSATTYAVQMRVNTGTTVGYVNRAGNDGDFTYTNRGASSITVMEIAG